MQIKVLGPGCASCRATYSLLEQVAKDKGVVASLAKVEDMLEIMKYGVMSTPCVVIDGRVVHAGGVPSRSKVEQWLSSSPAACATESAGGCCCGSKCKG